ncbi:MAG: nucleotidyltransferase domain-containing protein [Saccharolobus sp.]|uniref:Polymerase nucleotidyl transferase domain-containing protein n=1 Tax=Saccharolobus shibatae (strain ATCC 51178 / DSM 5389 / JCM 8931 / NBRC 15437 / B12) TaxID=523848 RepID=A0A8F5BQE1_SACSH|nr:nucleotidyltransferase domain-containing protein [Saccharolobus shibatae]MCH4816418.1 nucleotidyltransferase domain-containing protein [Saccharolobus shibatae]QXJ29424.1 hypothetical protein J5U23_02293 [Saccharolobus shibatae B12]
MVKGKSAIESQKKMLQLAIQIVEEVAKEYPSLAKVYVFGSRARGDYLDTSDIDLVFVMRGIKNINVIERMYLVSKFVKKGKVDYIVIDEEEKPPKDSKLLWSREKGFVNIEGFLI